MTPRRFRRRFQNTEIRPRPPVTHALAQDRSSQSELRDLSGKPRTRRMCACVYGTIMEQPLKSSLREHYMGGNVLHHVVLVHILSKCVYRALTRHIFSQRPQIEGYSVFIFELSTF